MKPPPKVKRVNVIEIKSWMETKMKKNESSEEDNFFELLGLFDFRERDLSAK